MADPIFVVDPISREQQKIESLHFSDIGITERNDLEQWIIAHPELLGEDLLVITSEFDRFDKSNKRLDILALDSEGVLVIIELKLDASRSLADLQSIRYAAFCSTMIMENVIELLSGFKKISVEEASVKICEFLRSKELPELNNRPRIILAAGSIDDQELTSCVLWLRNYGVDISCVELTPYRLPDYCQIILVPRIIIPLPEAKDIQIRAEKKEVILLQQATQRSEFKRLWQAVSSEFNKLGTPFLVDGESSGTYQQIIIENSKHHYEWLINKKTRCLEVALHFESSDHPENSLLTSLIQKNEAEIIKGIHLDFKTSVKKWGQAAFCLPYEGDYPTKNLAPEAARLMKLLIERTWSIIEPHIRK